MSNGLIDAPRKAPPAAAILLVDDDAAKRLAVSAMLAPLGHAIVEVDSGRAALRAAARQTFAVILMDVRMPTLDGYETAKLIREQGKPRITPIIFVTAFGCDETETTTAYANGGVDFIFTPINRDVLRAKISAFVDLFLQTQELQRSVQSITDLNAALRNSETRARAVLSNVADAILTAGADGRIQSFNRSARRLFGYTENEVIGQPVEFLLAHGDHDDSADVAPDCWSLPAARAIPAEPSEAVGHRKDGSRFHMELHRSQMQIGDETSAIYCIRDISALKQQTERERQRAQTARREAQRERIAFDEAPIGGIITDAQGTIQRASQAICLMLGYSAEELIGMHFLDITHPDDHDAGAAVVAALRSGDTGQQRFEKRYVHADGGVIHARVALTAIREDEHTIAQLYAQIEDVSDIRRTCSELEQSQFEMLARLAAAAELHDDDTGQHTRRVGDLAAAVAGRLGLSDTDVELIRFAAPLHDIGKLAIPDTLLGKPAKLTGTELALMRTHTTIGAQMLGGSAFALVKLAAEIALTHHERWDGDGYPGGHAGDAIPIAGRIVAIADVFDALTHARPYKAAWSTEDAIAEITRQAARHFDPEVHEAFLSVRADPPLELLSRPREC